MKSGVKGGILSATEARAFALCETARQDIDPCHGELLKMLGESSLFLNCVVKVFLLLLGK